MFRNLKKDIHVFYNSIKGLKVSRAKLLAIIMFTFMTNLIELLNPIIFGNIIDAIIKKSMESIKWNLFCMLIVFVLSNTLDYFNNLIQAKLTYNLDITMKKKTLLSIFRMPFFDFMKVNKGKLINNIEGDTSVYSDLLNKNVNIITNFVSMIISFLFMFYISPILTILVFITFPINIAIFVFSGSKLKEKEKDYKRKFDNYFTFIYESIQGWKVLKLFKGDIGRYTLFKDILQKLYSIEIMKFKIGNYSKIATDFVSLLSSILNIIIGIYLIFNGRLSLGMFTAFNNYSGNFKNMLLSFAALNSSIQESVVAINRVNEVLSYSEIKEDNLLDLTEKIKKISIKNLVYSNINGNNIFDGVNLEFNSNCVYLIKGQSGSGKTTLFNMLSRLIENYQGDIFINDRNIKTVDRKILREKMVYILQDNYIFTASVKENISLYSEVSFDLMVKVCKQLNIHNTIMSLPSKYDTIINMNGNELSGGERQRICIARALVRKPDIYLFDEITSSIDKSNSDEILKLIEDLSKTCIVIITSHSELKFSIPIKEFNLENKKIH